MALGYYKDGEWVPLLADRYDPSAAIGLFADTDFRLTESSAPTFSSIGPSPVGTFVTAASGVRAYYSPFIVTKAITITEARLVILNSGAGRAGDAFLHSADDNWNIVSGTTTTLATGLDFSTSGAKTITGLSLTLQPGRYLSEVFKNNADGVQFRTYSIIVGGAEFQLLDINHNLGVRLFSNSTTANTGWTSVETAGFGGFMQIFSWKWDWA